MPLWVRRWYRDPDRDWRRQPESRTDREAGYWSGTLRLRAEVCGRAWAGRRIGTAQRFRTMAGLFLAYEHEVTIHTLGVEFQSGVFFAQDMGFNRNFLGRSGWLDRLRVGIIDYDRLLFLSNYDS